MMLQRVGNTARAGYFVDPLVDHGEAIVPTEIVVFPKCRFQLVDIVNQQAPPIPGAILPALSWQAQ